MDCLFCKFADGRIKVDKVYEDERMYIIRDIAPKAKLHYLIIPKAHCATLSDMNESQAAELGHCLFRLSELRDELGLKDGYRLIINQGQHAGQTVMHLHIHVLGGQELPFESLELQAK